MLRRVMMAGTQHSGPSLDSTILALSPWGYWKLDENPIGAGVPATDSSGGGNHGTYSSASALSVPGLIGGSSRAMRFPNSFGQHGVPIPSFPYPSGEKLSIVSFIDVPAVDGVVRSIFGSDSSGGGRLWQWRLFNGRLEFVTILPTVVTVASATTLSLGSTHLACVVYDPALPVSGGRVKIYIDGTLDISGNVNVSIPSGPANCAIGNRANTAFQDADTFRNGTIDNVALFRGYALSAADVAAIWAARNIA